MKTEKIQEIFKSCSNKKCRFCNEEIKEYDPEKIQFIEIRRDYIFFHEDCFFRPQGRRS